MWKFHGSVWQVVGNMYDLWCCGWSGKSGNDGMKKSATWCRFVTRVFRLFCSFVNLV